MAPLRKKAETRLADARAALSDTSRQIGVIEAQRGKAILDEDDTAARKLDAELEELRRDARIGADRVRLLEQQAKDEEQAAVLQRRKAHVARFTKKLADADQVADELQACVEQEDKLYRRLIQLREDARAAWWGSTPHEMALSISPDGCALSGLAVKALLMHEKYRVGARPFVGGNPAETQATGPTWRPVSRPQAARPASSDRTLRRSHAQGIAGRHRCHERQNSRCRIRDTNRVPDTQAPPPAPSGNGGTSDQPTLAAF